MMDYILHFLIALVGAGVGIYARAWCRHPSHQITVGTLLLLVETVITVRLVG